MARISEGSAMLSPSARAADPLADLTRLLNRLQQTVLRADAERERRLRASEYERRRVETNITYARSLLAKIDQDALAVKVHTRRQELLTDLNRKREVLDLLTERMNDLEEIANAAEDDDDTSDGEDILAGIIATPSESLDSRSTSGVVQENFEEGAGPEEREDEPLPAPEVQAEPPQPQSHAPSFTEPIRETVPPVREIHTTQESSATLSEKAETTISQTIRSRGPQPTATTEEDTGRTTGSSLLGGNHRSASISQTATTEAILDHQRAEQDLLSESIVKMAGDLKESSKAFSQSLEDDKDALGRAGEGLDRSERGLEAAARRMGALRRMTEGKGWWGRVLLYAWIYGLMVLLVVVVFVLPKLRF